MNEHEHEVWNDKMARSFNPDSFISETGFLIRWVESRRLKASVSALQCRPNSVVLDLGCGPGNLTQQLIGSEVIGLDLSTSMLEQAKIKTQHLHHIRLKKGSGEKMSFGDNHFDRIICSEVLEHTLNPRKILGEIHRVAKNGARVVITIPNESLINFAKKVVLRLGLKKVVAGAYPMSDNMLSEWHVAEIESHHLYEMKPADWELKRVTAIPFRAFSFHTVFTFVVHKTH